MIHPPRERNGSFGHSYREMCVDRCRVRCVFHMQPRSGVSSSIAALRLAENLVADALGIANRRVRAATLLPSGRPIVTVIGRASCPTISVSHVRTMYGAALSLDGQVGMDIVDPSDVMASLQTFFTAEERAMLPKPARHLYGRLWAAKEAAYKAARLDVEFQPLRVRVHDLAADRFRWCLSGPHGCVEGAGRLMTVDQCVVAIAVTQGRREHTVGAAGGVETMEEVARCF